MELYAHSTSRTDKSDWQRQNAHSLSVGGMAGDRAEWFGARSLAQVAGVPHDLGKYTERFQKRLEGEVPRMDHVTWGVVVARQRYPSLGPLLAYVIARRHTDLAIVSSSETEMWFDGGHCKVVIGRVW